MLRSRVLAIACLVLLPPLAARAETDKVEAVPSSGAPHIAAAAISTVSETQSTAAPATATAVPAAETAPAAVVPEKAAEAAKPVPPAPPTLTAQIDLATQTMIVSENGSRVHAWPISSGTEEFPTPRGTFRPQWTAKMWYSRKYDNAPMPNAVFINGGVAVHATSHVRSLGRPASHGCIRLAPGNAKAFYSLVHKHGLKMTRVSVYGNPKWSAPAVASRRTPAPRARYAAAEQDNGSWWSSGSAQKKYQPASAYDPGFTKQRRLRPLPPGYVYVNPQQRVYRNAYGQRVVYVQRPPQRRTYYYNNSGYGYGGGW